MRHQRARKTTSNGTGIAERNPSPIAPTPTQQPVQKQVVNARTPRTGQLLFSSLVSRFRDQRAHTRRPTMATIVTPARSLTLTLMLTIFLRAALSQDIRKCGDNHLEPIELAHYIPIPFVPGCLLFAVSSSLETAFPSHSYSACVQVFKRVREIMKSNPPIAGEPQKQWLLAFIIIFFATLWFHVYYSPRQFANCLTFICAFLCTTGGRDGFLKRKQNRGTIFIFCPRNHPFDKV